jgi:hypothetical protein
MLVARLASGLLYFLFDITMHGLVALVALVVVVPLVPGASSGDASDMCSVTMTLKPRRQVSSGRRWMLPIELHERALG